MRAREVWGRAAPPGPQRVVVTDVRTACPADRSRTPWPGEDYDNARLSGQNGSMETRTKRSVAPWLRPLLVTALLGVAGFLLYLGAQSQSEVVEPVRRAGLIRVFPLPDTVALRQDAVGAEIQFEYSGRLTIDRREIPDDQLDRIDVGRNRVSFVPGAGQEIESLDEGRHCATLTYWVTASGEESAGRPFTWCFIAA